MWNDDFYNFMNTRDSDIGGIIVGSRIIWSESDKIEMSYDANNVQTICLYELRDNGYNDYKRENSEIYEVYNHFIIQEFEQEDKPNMYSRLLERSTPRTICNEYDTSQPNYKSMINLIPIIFRN